MQNWQLDDILSSQSNNMRLVDTTKGFTENFSCQIWNIILVIKNRPFLLLKLSNFTWIFGYFQWKRSARDYLVISQKRVRFFSVNFIYIGGIYIYICIYIALHCIIYIYIYTVYYTPVIYVLKKKKKSNVGLFVSLE